MRSELQLNHWFDFPSPIGRARVSCFDLLAGLHSYQAQAGYDNGEAASLVAMNSRLLHYGCKVTIWGLIGGCEVAARGLQGG